MIADRENDPQSPAWSADAPSAPGHRDRARRVLRPIAALAVCASLGLGGCSTIIAGTLTLSDFSNVAGMISTLSTGKGLEEHVLSWVTGKDCKIFDGVVRSDRKICEEKNSIGTDKDFKGVYVMLFGEELEQTPARRYAQDVNHKRLAELRPEPEQAPSMVRSRRRAAPALANSGSRFTDGSTRSQDDRLGTVLAAAAPVVQDQRIVRTRHQPRRGAHATGDANRNQTHTTAPGAAATTRISAADLGLLARHRPSLSQITRQAAVQPNANNTALADGRRPQGDSLDRLSGLWWPADGSERVVILKGDETPPLSPQRGATVDYQDGGVAVELVFESGN
ncbi:MAG: hypothetical protein ACFB6R_02115 [Alphaproteobacteria bacterium]